jgi:hypothetical protein
MGDSNGVEFPDAIDARLESNDARLDFCALSLSNSLMIDSCSDLRRRVTSPTIPLIWISARSSCVVQWGYAAFAEEHAPPIAPMSLGQRLKVAPLRPSSPRPTASAALFPGFTTLTTRVQVGRKVIALVRPTASAALFPGFTTPTTRVQVGRKVIALVPLPLSREVLREVLVHLYYPCKFALCAFFPPKV